MARPPWGAASVAGATALEFVAVLLLETDLLEPPPPHAGRTSAAATRAAACMSLI
jgi:hypothetical protein